MTSRAGKWDIACEVVDVGNGKEEITETNSFPLSLRILHPGKTNMRPKIASQCST